MKLAPIAAVLCLLAGIACVWMCVKLVLQERSIAETEEHNLKTMHRFLKAMGVSDADIVASSCRERRLTPSIGNCTFTLRNGESGALVIRKGKVSYFSAVRTYDPLPEAAIRSPEDAKAKFIRRFGEFTGRKSEVVEARVVPISESCSVARDVPDAANVVDLIVSDEEGYVAGLICFSTSDGRLISWRGQGSRSSLRRSEVTHWENPSRQR